MNYEINDLTELAYDGGEALTTTPVVGTPPEQPEPADTVGGGPVADGAIRVTILGSGDPFVNRSQASASVLIEVGNAAARLLLLRPRLRGPGQLQRSAAPRHRHHQGVPDPPARRPRRRHAHPGVEHGQGRPARPGRGVGARPASGPRRSAPAPTRSTSRPCPRLGHRVAVRPSRTVRCRTPMVTEVPYDTPSIVYDRNGVTDLVVPVSTSRTVPSGTDSTTPDGASSSPATPAPARTLVDACDGADLLIHETFPSAGVYAQEGRRAAGVRRADRQRGAHQPRRWQAGSSTAPAHGCR